MERVNDFALDRQGNALQGVQVIAYEAGTAGTGSEVPVQMYNKNDPIAANEINSATTDSEGEFGFYVENDRIDLKLTLGASVQIVHDYLVFDPEDVGIELDQPIALAGSQIFSGDGPPDAGLGNTNDYYIEQDKDVFWRKFSTGWDTISNFHGSELFIGSGQPSAGTGIDGDWYIDKDADTIYQKEAAAWTLRVNFHGSVIIRGTGTPDVSIGLDGDWYINDANGDLYNRASGGWFLVTNVRGTRFFKADGLPPNGLGVDGDYYIRTDTQDLYSKAAGTWSVEFSMRGPAGADGATVFLEVEPPVDTVGKDGDIYINAADPGGFAHYKKVNGVWEFVGYVTAPENELGPGAIASLTASQNVNAGQWTTVEMDSITMHPVGGFSNAAGVITAHLATDKVQVNGTAIFGQDGGLLPGDFRGARLVHTRGATATIVASDSAGVGGGEDDRASCSGVIDLQINDTLELQVYNDSSGDVSSLPNSNISIQAFGGPRGARGPEGPPGELPEDGIAGEILTKTGPGPLEFDWQPITFETFPILPTETGVEDRRYHYYDARRYHPTGNIGDGAAPDDDDIALQRALQSIAASNGQGRLHISSVDNLGWQVLTPLEIIGNTSVSGDGHGSILIAKQSMQNIIELAKGWVPGQGNTRGGVLSNFFVDGNGLADWGIYYGLAVQRYMYQVAIYRCVDHGLILDSSQNNYFGLVQVEENLGIGLGLYNNANSNEFVKCELNDSDGHNLFMGDDPSLPTNVALGGNNGTNSFRNILAERSSNNINVEIDVATNLMIDGGIITGTTQSNALVFGQNSAYCEIQNLQITSSNLGDNAGIVNHGFMNGARRCQFRDQSGGTNTRVVDTDNHFWVSECGVPQRDADFWEINLINGADDSVIHYNEASRRVFNDPVGSQFLSDNVPVKTFAYRNSGRLWFNFGANIGAKEVQVEIHNSEGDETDTAVGTSDSKTIPLPNEGVYLLTMRVNLSGNQNNRAARSWILTVDDFNGNELEDVSPLTGLVLSPPSDVTQMDASVNSDPLNRTVTVTAVASQSQTSWQWQWRIQQFYKYPT